MKRAFFIQKPPIITQRLQCTATGSARGVCVGAVQRCARAVPGAGRSTARRRGGALASVSCTCNIITSPPAVADISAVSPGRVGRCEGQRGRVRGASRVCAVDAPPCRRARISVCARRLAGPRPRVPRVCRSSAVTRVMNDSLLGAKSAVLKSIEISAKRERAALFIKLADIHVPVSSRCHG